MKKILITGAGGFIGSHLTELLVKEGYEITALVHYNSKNNWGWLEDTSVKKDIQVVTGDIRDFDFVFNSMKGKDTVFHLAALIGIPYSYVSPLAYIKTNVEGTYNVLEASRNLSVENTIVTSTSETYGTAQYVPIDEKHPLVGQSPYSATKIAADQIALSYYRSFDLPVKVVRPFNTYGPRQSARAFIPTVISQILSGMKVIKLGNLTPTRDLTFVEDTVQGFYNIAQSNNTLGEVTNIGMQEEISMSKLVELISSIIGKEISIVSDNQRIRPEKSEVDRLFCNNSKIIKSTNWRPKYNLEKGIQITINWIEENIHLFKPEIYNV
jgi:NAD dependent epimerase/dehydratase